MDTGQIGAGNWIIGGDFNIITNLREKKGGSQFLDKYQEAFCDFITHNSLIDAETGNYWFTWNNK